MHQTKISVIIVVYNLKKLLEQCLYSLQVAVAGLDTDIIVVDDHSTDGTVEYLQPLFPDVKFMENKEQTGFVKSVNKAIGVAIGEYVLILNPVAIIGEDSIRTLCFFMDEHPDAGAAGVRMLDVHGVFLNEKKEHKRNTLSRDFMFLRREALDKAGLFDESFTKKGVDIELSCRLKEKGYKNYFLPEERILLYKNGSDKQEKGLMKLFFRKKKNKSTRMLIICREKSFEPIKECAVKMNPELEYINLWDLDENRVMDAICRRNQMKAFTDIAFCYPEVRFEQMLLLMDTMVDKNITYHIYNTQSGLLISPES